MNTTSFANGMRTLECFRKQASRLRTWDLHLASSPCHEKLLEGLKLWPEASAEYPRMMRAGSNIPFWNSKTINPKVDFSTSSTTSFQDFSIDDYGKLPLGVEAWPDFPNSSPAALAPTTAFAENILVTIPSVVRARSDFTTRLQFEELGSGS